MGDFFNSSTYDIYNKNEEKINEQDRKFRDLNVQNLVNVSLSQIAKFTRREEGLAIFRQKISSIHTIGVVVSVEELTTKNVYIIDDYSVGSPIEVQLWKNDGDENGARRTIVPTVFERTYIHVIGQARYDDRKPFIVAYHISPLEDPNEISLHFFKVIHDSIFLEKRMNEVLNKDPKMTGTINDIITKDQTFGFTEIQNTVLNVLNKYGRDSPYGLKRYEIQNYIPNYNQNQINNAIEFLVNEGHIFSTIDEDTFKSTDY